MQSRGDSALAVRTGARVQQGPRATSLPHGSPGKSLRNPGFTRLTPAPISALAKVKTEGMRVGGGGDGAGTDSHSSS